MTPEDLGRSRLAALTGAAEPAQLGAELLAGARARSGQARRLAAHSRAGGRGAEGRRVEAPGDDGYDRQPGDDGVWRAVADHRPARRWSVSWRAAVAGAVALALVGGVVVLRTLTAAPEVLVSTAEPSRDAVADAAEAAGETGAADGPAVVTVHVVGAVAHPGVVSVPAGSRAVDAVAAAGGASQDADLVRVNLARPLADGEQVVVPRAGEPGVAAGGADAGILDLNAADAAALEALPRIGPVLAERIIAWRTEHGRFSSVDELAEVPGIGPALLAALDGLIRV